MCFFDIQKENTTVEGAINHLQSLIVFQEKKEE